ncbi:MAG: hypothetical protein M1160_02785 [Candidatus Marsarchaeota archaeon]|jgi:hypothetical protein|nr:hypothetical protein [Candidatus Marsarchaeota archaeon]MCL5111779.1 hypothetical protein [Candidatus Marsarchaeota archaeon]
MDQKIFALIGLLGVSIVLLIIAIGTPQSLIPSPLKIVLLIVALAFDAIAFTSRRYYYMMVPLLRQRSKNIVLSNEEPYWLSSSGDAIIRRERDWFIATAYISIPFYRSATEMTDVEKLEFSRQMSRLVGISSEPVRFTTEMYLMNKDAYIQELHDAINQAELEEAQLASGADTEKLEIARGKLAMWRNIMQNASAVQSLEITSYAAVSAAGAKEYEAISMVQQKARDVVAGIGTTLGVTPSVITGSAILKFVEPEYLIPFSTVREQMETKTEEQVI